MAAGARKQQEQGCSQGRGARSSLCTVQAQPWGQAQSPAMAGRAGGDASGSCQHTSSKVIHGRPNISSGAGLRQSHLQPRQELEALWAWRLNGASDRESKCEAQMKKLFLAIKAS